jgi:hypothetical protein
MPVVVNQSGYDLLVGPSKVPLAQGASIPVSSITLDAAYSFQLYYSDGIYSGGCGTSDTSDTFIILTDGAEKQAAIFTLFDFTDCYKTIDSVTTPAVKDDYSAGYTNTRSTAIVVGAVVSDANHPKPTPKKDPSSPADPAKKIPMILYFLIIIAVIIIIAIVAGLAYRHYKMKNR